MNQWKTLHCSMFSRPSPTFKWINRQTNEEVGNVENLYKLVEDHSTSNLTVSVTEFQKLLWVWKFEKASNKYLLPSFLNVV